jgi:hypothetical protein
MLLIILVRVIDLAVQSNAHTFAVGEQLMDTSRLLTGSSTSVNRLPLLEHMRRPHSGVIQPASSEPVCVAYEWLQQECFENILNQRWYKATDRRLALLMTSPRPSHDMWHGRDRQPSPLGYTVVAFGVASTRMKTLAPFAMCS